MLNKTGLGILLPIQRGETGFFRQGFDAITQVKSNLINLLLTKKGERVMQPSFGSNLHNLVFDKITPNTQASVRAAIDEAVQIWLPFVLINEVRVAKDEDTHTVLVEVGYSLRTNESITDTITLVLSDNNAQ